MARLVATCTAIKLLLLPDSLGLLLSGEWRKEMLAEIPAQDVKQDIKVGDGLRMSNGLRAVVHKIENGMIIIDANKPLAGKSLNIEVELLRLTKVDTQSDT